MAFICIKKSFYQPNLILIEVDMSDSCKGLSSLKNIWKDIVLFININHSRLRYLANFIFLFKALEPSRLCGVVSKIRPPIKSFSSVGMAFSIC